MIRSLRKGRTSVYLQHELIGNTIGAEKFEAEVVGGKAVLRFSLRPVSGNQAHDEGYFHENPLQSLDVDDSAVIRGLDSHMSMRRDEFSAWELQVLSRGRCFTFPVKPQYQRQQAREVLRMVVEKCDG